MPCIWTPQRFDYIVEYKAQCKFEDHPPYVFDKRLIEELPIRCYGCGKLIRYQPLHTDSYLLAELLGAVLSRDTGVFGIAPCFACGYEGEGYYQPMKHPCAYFYHEYLKGD